jgi:hypothetical protein
LDFGPASVGLRMQQDAGELLDAVASSHVAHCCVDPARRDGSSSWRPRVRPLRSRGRLRGAADAWTSKRRPM